MSDGEMSSGDISGGKMSGGKMSGCEKFYSQLRRLSYLNIALYTCVMPAAKPTVIIKTMMCNIFYTDVAH